MKFTQIKNMDGSVASDLILFTDDNGELWTVPAGHRFWTLYEDWMAAGNVPLPAQ
jgi:hypothetical protein